MKNKKLKKGSYLYHLEEFRIVLISIFIILLVSFVFSMTFAEKIVILLQEPIKQTGVKLSYFSPEEKFLTYLKIGFVSAIFISLPFAIILLGRFVYPALKKNERKYFYIFLFLLPVIFYAGGFFAYKIIFPFAIRFFYNFAGGVTLIPVWGISNYFNLLITLITGTGIVFLLPLPLIFLIKAGVISVETINRLRFYIIVVILIIAAVFSPPDVLSQILVAIPLYLLFEISVIIGKLMK
ncbi:MAG: twin-arginine translocase subunit TatC [Candidatus Goldbacteria bacterium]|nr:twin-arginine translocase subunit TatC [Candidatus Goldiibacteriota bacterium]